MKVGSEFNPWTPLVNLVAKAFESGERSYFWDG
jgi:hypothetical protein